MLLFQFQGVAEEWLSPNQWRNFRTLFRHPDEDTGAQPRAPSERLLSARPGPVEAGLARASAAGGLVGSPPILGFRRPTSNWSPLGTKGPP